jgi:hypothetical protein
VAFSYLLTKQPPLNPLLRFIASAGTYANLVRQAKSKQKIIDKMEAAGLIEKVEAPRPLRCVHHTTLRPVLMFSSFRFNFEDIRRLPPPIIAFDDVAFSYSGEKKDYLYERLSFGIEYVILDVSPLLEEKSHDNVPPAWIPASLFLARMVPGSPPSSTSSLASSNHARVPYPNTSPSNSQNTPNTLPISFLTTKVRSSTSKPSFL